MEKINKSSAISLQPIIELNTNDMAPSLNSTFKSDMENLANIQNLSSDEINEKPHENFCKETKDSDLDKHLLPPVPIKCEICSTKFKIENMRKEHLDGHDFLYFCKTCGANVTLTLDFIDLVRDYSTDNLYKCPLCKIKIKERTAITSHLQTMHSQFTQYVCKVCKKGINNYTQFLNHKFIHIKDKPFRCDQCGSSFDRNILLHRHTVRMHVDNPISCEVCQKICRNELQLQTHKMRHDRKPTVCETCGKTFSRKDSLQIHERIHTGEKPYICRFCPKSFTSTSTRYNHETTHTGYTPSYICLVCNKSFLRQNHLKEHEAHHRPDGPIQCNGCTQQFNTIKVYNAHIKTCKRNSAVQPQVNEEVNCNEGLGQKVLQEENNPERHNIRNSESPTNYESLRRAIQNAHQALSSEMINLQQNQQESKTN